MSDIQITDQKFDLDPEIDAEALIFRSNESGQLIEVNVYESAYKRFKANLPTKIFKESKAGTKKIKVQFNFDNLAFINEWLLQFAENVEIISPEQLIEKRKTTLKKMMMKLN